MRAEQLESEQALLGNAQASVDTLRRLIQERDAYRDALEKIKATRYSVLTFEAKYDRMIEIADKTLENWK